MGKPWFRTKVYGYGADLPCSWEGWAVMVAFVVALFSLHAIPDALTKAHPWLEPTLRVLLILALILVGRAKSDRPWFSCKQKD
jgi:hypothetical protein